MRLIDADALIVQECERCDGMCEEFDGKKCLACKSPNRCEMRLAIEEAKTVDAVCVVRCKDCEWRRYGEMGAGSFGYFCELTELPLEPDEYCSSGTREERETDGKN